MTSMLFMATTAEILLLAAAWSLALTACERQAPEPQALELQGTARPAPARQGAVPREQVAEHEPAPPRTVRHLKAEGQLGPGRGTLLIGLRPPNGGKLAVGAPVRVTAKGRDLTFPEALRTQLDPDQLPLRLPVIVSDGAADPAELDLTYYWCDVGDAGSCHPVRVHLVVELDLSGSGAGGEAHLTHRPES